MTISVGIPRAQTNTGSLTVPNDLPIGRYTLTVTATSPTTSAVRRSIDGSLKHYRQRVEPSSPSITILGSLAIPITASATSPWLQHIVGASTLESALFRAMQLPAAQALYPRPPKEAQAQLAQVIAANPGNAELYELRARAEEQALDEAAAEWTGSSTLPTPRTPSPPSSNSADFYSVVYCSFHRRSQSSTKSGVHLRLSQPKTGRPHPAAFLGGLRSILRRLILQICRHRRPRPPFSAPSSRALRTARSYAAFLQFRLEQHDSPTTESLIALRPSVPQDHIFPIAPRPCWSSPSATSMPPSLSTMPSNHYGRLELIQFILYVLDRDPHRQRVL